MFCINLLKTRKLKWIVFVLVIVSPITYLIFTSPVVADYSALEMLLMFAKFNLPFLPDLFLHVENQDIKVIVFYFLYFVLPLFYFYFMYLLSKLLLKKGSIIFKKWMNKFQIIAISLTHGNVLLTSICYFKSMTCDKQ